MLDTRPMLMVSDFPAVTRGELDTLQVNLGYRCNLSCTHCHVGAGPTRSEQMDRETIQDVLTFLRKKNISTLDLTGGAPELNPYFRELVEDARKMGVHVIDRCNLTVLLEQGQETLADFLAEHQVEVVASLPCYAEQNVDQQRGKGVYQQSIDALKLLNRLGYGQCGSLRLNLVYNPGGAFLPPSQAGLEQDYKRELASRHGIVFDHLFVLANMPISRFGSVLLSRGQFYDYMKLLKSNYAAQNLEQVMCRHLISVDWRGQVYDCDFNQMLDMPLTLLASDRPRPHLRDLLARELEGQPIAVADHCYGCTAGQGSSCGGAL